MRRQQDEDVSHVTLDRKTLCRLTTDVLAELAEHVLPHLPPT